MSSVDWFKEELRKHLINLGFDIDELLLVDKNLLNEADAISVKAYIDKRDNIIDQMNKMVGNLL